MTQIAAAVVGLNKLPLSLNGGQRNPTAYGEELDGESWLAFTCCTLHANLSRMGLMRKSVERRGVHVNPASI